MKFKKIFNFKELTIISFIFFSIIYSTSFHYSNSAPNDTFEPAQFLVHTSPKGGGDTNIAKYFPDYGLLYEKLFSNGSWPEEFHPRNITGWNDMWKSSAMAVDNAYYIMYAGYYAGLIEEIDYTIPGADLTMAVHKYRVLLPFIVGKICSLSKLSKNSNYVWSEKYYTRIVHIFILINLICIFLTAFIFLFFLINVFSFSKTLSIFGSTLFITLPIVTKSVGFPQVEPLALLITLLMFLSVYYKKAHYFLLLAFLGTLTRDLFIFAPVLWFFNYNFIENNSFKLKFSHLVISIVPILFFILQRFYFSGEFVLETRGTYDLLQGELPPIVFFDNFGFGTVRDLLTKLFLVFTFLWLGVLNIKKNKFLMKSSFALIFLILISLWIARGSGIERHVGLMFPIIIPSFLYFFKDNLKI